MRLRSERIITPSGTVAGEVSIVDGRISTIGPVGRSPDVIELERRWLAPGYIDTHVHGGAGAQCNTANPDEIAAVARFHAAHGTTALLASTVAATPDELCTALEAIARSPQAAQAAQAAQAGGAGRAGQRGGALVLGAHLEGPFLSRHRPGAMDPETFRDPDLSTVDRLLRAGGGIVRMMTLAPELPGALGLISRLVDHGAVASIGHSDAGYDQVRAAVAAGARSATHTFNAMAPLHHRRPGVLGAVLDLPEINCELICDGVHVSPVAMRLACRAKGALGIRLVTDAMQAAGMPDGEYRLGTARVTVAGPLAQLAGGEAIAGSTLTMDEAVRGAVRWLGLTVEHAIGLATANPARVLGLADRKGSITPGLDADLVVLDDSLHVCAAIVAGEWVPGPPAGIGR